MRINPSGTFLASMSRASLGRGMGWSQWAYSVSPGIFFESFRVKFVASTFALAMQPGNFCLTALMACFMHSLRMVGYGVAQLTLHFSLRTVSALDLVSLSLKSYLTGRVQKAPLRGSFGFL